MTLMRLPVVALAFLALAVPASAQEVRKWTIHFGENETTLSPADRATLGAAIEMAQECEKASVSLTGYDDTTHPPLKADEVSMARAETVRKTIVDAGGVNAEFKMDARGRRQLPVPTPDGVSERQNRRVDISVACK